MKLSENLIGIIVKYIGNDTDIDYDIPPFYLDKLRKYTNIHTINSDIISEKILNKYKIRYYPQQIYNKNYFSWEYSDLTIKLIENTPFDKINFTGLSGNKTIPIEFLENYYNIIGNKLVRSEQYTDHPLCDLYWYNISKNPSIPQSFFEKILNLNTKEMSKYAEKIDWQLLCSHPNLSESFFVKCLNHPQYFKQMWLTIICRRSNIHLSFLENPFTSPINGNLYKPIQFVSFSELCKNPNIPDTFFERTDFKNIKGESYCGLDTDIFPFILEYNKTTEFITRIENNKKYNEKINWAYISANKNLPFEFFEKNLDKIHYEWLIINPVIYNHFKKKSLIKLLLQIL